MALGIGGACAGCALAPAPARGGLASAGVIEPILVPVHLFEPRLMLFAVATVIEIVGDKIPPWITRSIPCPRAAARGGSLLAAR